MFIFTQYHHIKFNLTFSDPTSSLQFLVAKCLEYLDGKLMCKISKQPTAGWKPADFKLEM
jgi:hypothetical protein